MGLKGATKLVKGSTLPDPSKEAGFGTVSDKTASDKAVSEFSVRDREASRLLSVGPSLDPAALDCCCDAIRDWYSAVLACRARAWASRAACEFASRLDWGDEPSPGRDKLMNWIVPRPPIATAACFRLSKEDLLASGVAECLEVFSLSRISDETNRKRGETMRSELGASVYLGTAPTWRIGLDPDPTGITRMVKSVIFAAWCFEGGRF